ncbi:hypothetical protein, partial [uncultured Paracoccus sp.]|uniref:hypothetical protein n=1 Tax=uncultured Paracoccus sp. TaxID=189685 RepID=UPI0025D6F4CB
ASSLKPQASSLKPQASSLKYCLVIAPSKEDVLPDFHPLKAASVSIVDAIYSSIFTAGVPVSCPIRRLRQEADSYYPTDTHWSDLGAYICVRDILETLKIDLPDDFELQFEDMEVAGDLGSKLTPARRSRRKVLARQERSAKLTFDNRVLGSSGIQIYENDKPVIDDTVLIFGGSSSDQLSRVMAEIFRKIMRVNSPLTMPIIEVVDTVAPGIVLMQTNARYLKSCPKLAKTIADSALSKLDHTGFPQGWLQGKHSG